MNKYLMTIRETSEYQCYVYAKDEDDAEDKVNYIFTVDMWENSKRAHTDIECEKVNTDLEDKFIPSFYLASENKP